MPQSQPRIVTDGRVAHQAGPLLRPALPPLNSKQWYALRLRPNREFVVREFLEALGIETFLPGRVEAVSWSDREKAIERPLFPGYIFVRADLTRRRVVVELLKIPGVMHALVSNLDPRAIGDREIANVRRVLEAKVAVERCPHVAGETVEIGSGPLRGVSGTILREGRGTRVVVSVCGLNGAVSVEVDEKELEQ